MPESKKWRPERWTREVIRRVISDARRQVYRLAPTSESAEESRGFGEAVMELCQSEAALEAIECSAIAETCQRAARRLVIELPLRTSAEAEKGASGGSNSDSEEAGRRRPDEAVRRRRNRGSTGDRFARERGDREGRAAGEARGKVFSDSLRASTTNPRKRFEPAHLEDLAASIRERGVLQPLLVRPAATPKDARPGLSDVYEIVAGECRWRAATLAGLAHVPCIVRMLDDQAAQDAQLVENLQRRDLSPLEEAAAFQERLKAAGDAGAKLSVDELGKRIGKSGRWVRDRLDLLKLTGEAREGLESRLITAGHAAELARLEPELQGAAFNKALEGLSVMQLRCWIVDAKAGYGAPGRVARASAKASDMPTKAQLAAYDRATQLRRVPTSRTIDESCSVELLANGGSRIRPPYEHAGKRWCSTATSYMPGKDPVHEAYRVVKRSEFSGRTIAATDRAKRRANAARNPKGAYHGLAVSCAGHELVLVGPPRKFTGRRAAHGRKEDRRTEPSGAEIERALKQSLHSLRFQFGFSPSQLGLFPRKRGEWVVRVKHLRTSAKAKRRAA